MLMVLRMVRRRRKFELSAHIYSYVDCMKSAMPSNLVACAAFHIQSIYVLCRKTPQYILPTLSFFVCSSLKGRLYFGFVQLARQQHARGGREAVDLAHREGDASRPEVRRAGALMAPEIVRSVDLYPDCSRSSGEIVGSISSEL